MKDVHPPRPLERYLELLNVFVPDFFHLLPEFPPFAPSPLTEDSFAKTTLVNRNMHYGRQRGGPANGEAQRDMWMKEGECIQVLGGEGGFWLTGGILRHLSS